MRIEYLREFLTLARELNFTRAADRLYTGESTLSRHLKSIENELGSDAPLLLMNRSTHGVTLTKEGEIALEGFAKVIEQYDEVCKALRGSAHSVEGVLRVGILHLAGDRYVSPIRAHLKKAHPGLSLDFAPSASLEGMLQDVLRGTVDVALACMDWTMDGRVAFTPICTDEIVVMCSKADPMASMESVTLDDIKRRKILATPHTKRLFRYMRILEEEGVPVALQDDSWSFALFPSLISETQAVTFVPRHISNISLESTTMVRVNDDRFFTHIGFSYLKETQAVRALLEASREVYGEALP